MDVEPSKRDAQKAEVVLQGDAGVVAKQLTQALGALRISRWQNDLKAKVRPTQFT